MNSLDTLGVPLEASSSDDYSWHLLQTLNKSNLQPLILLCAPPPQLPLSYLTGKRQPFEGPKEGVVCNGWAPIHRPSRYSCPGQGISITSSPAWMLLTVLAIDLALVVGEHE